MVIGDGFGVGVGIGVGDGGDVGVDDGKKKARARNRQTGGHRVTHDKGSGGGHRARQGKTTPVE